MSPGGVSFVCVFNFGFHFSMNSEKTAIFVEIYEKDLIRLCFTNLFQVGIILKHMFGIFLIFSYATLQKLYIACTKSYRETAFLG